MRTIKLWDVDGFQLVYRQSEPFFKSGKHSHAFAKSMNLRFFAGDPRKAMFFTLSLKRIEDGWNVYLKEPDTLINGVGLVQPGDIWTLVKKLNESIRCGVEFDAKQLMNNWVVYENTYCRNAFLPLLAESIDHLPQAFSPNDIILTYQKGRPIFFQDNAVGHHIGLRMGSCGFAEYTFPVVDFSIMLSSSEQGYRVTWDKSAINDHGSWYDTSGWMGDATWCDYKDSIQAHYSEPDVKFAAVVDQCNQAIQQGEVFNLAEFSASLLRWDKSAHLQVSTNILCF